MGKWSSFSAALFLRLWGDKMESKKVLREKMKILKGSVIIIGKIRE